MTLMDAIRAEVKDWAQRQEVAPSDEVMQQFYADSLDNAQPEELAGASLTAVMCMLQGRAVPREEFLNCMGVWCAAVMLGVRAVRRFEEAKS